MLYKNWQGLGTDSSNLLWPMCVAGDLVEEGSGSGQIDIICLNGHHKHGFSYRSEPTEGLGDSRMHTAQPVVYD